MPPSFFSFANSYGGLPAYLVSSENYTRVPVIQGPDLFYIIPSIYKKENYHGYNVKYSNRYTQDTA